MLSMRRAQRKSDKFGEMALVSAKICGLRAGLWLLGLCAIGNEASPFSTRGDGYSLTKTRMAHEQADC